MDSPSPHFPPTGPGSPASETPRDRAIRRLRSWKPSPEEKAILERARARGVSYSSIGVLSFAGAGFAFARYRKLNLLPTFMITSVAAFFGDQGGRLFSMYLGIKEMQTLPNSELRDIMKGFQKETMGGPVKPLDPEPVPVPSRTPTSSSYPLGQAPSSAPNSAQPQTAASAWDKLRKETGRNSAWDALRSGRKPMTPSLNDHNDNDDAHDSDSPSALRLRTPASNRSSENESAWDHLRHSPESSDASSTWDSLRSGSGDVSSGSTPSGHVGLTVPPSMPQPPPAPYSGVATGMSNVRRNAYGDPVE